MKKLAIRSFLYLIVILSIPYLYFVWQAKQAVDTFLIIHPTEVEFQYEWLWVNLDGKITLQDISFYTDSDEPLITAKEIEIIPSSLFDLLNSEEHMIYKEFPPNITIKLIGAETAQAEKLFALFDVNYTPAVLDYFYPKQCVAVLDLELPYLHFDVTSQFEIHQTADENDVRFKFESTEFANFTGSFKLNNFTEQGEDIGYLSDLSLSFSELSWLQQNTQKCLQTVALDRAQFSQLYTQFFLELAKENNLLLTGSAIQNYVDFIFVPQTVRLGFNLQDGLTFDRVSLDPIYEYQDKSGLSINLNGTQLAPVFQAFDYISAAEEKKVEQKTEEIEKTKPKTTHLSLNKRALTPYLGAKIEITLYNKKVVIGYLETANNRSIKISQLKYKGKTILPFAFKDIKSIVVLRTEK